ncbi:MAG: cob(I)yrinic acid a,c-diamide adenosyltransferase [Rhodocyclaceae bacterium]|jgi:cob(I)alamin adenosyltransferase|nr:cob(I)yrinic acid a,c-diamide adenosyltransferase [Rhodocyclaceae bacterium]
MTTDNNINNDETGRNERHQQRMVRKKDVVDEKIAAAQTEKGLLLIHTGNGKGKSSSAFGVLARAVGHGLNCAVIQFVKSRSDSGEEAFFRQFPAQVSWQVMGEGFTWETQDRERDKRAAIAAWEEVCKKLADPKIGLVILDEFTYAFKFGWLDLEPVIATLARRPPMQHVIITGRAAPPELVAVADTVTEMGMVKHAFQQGIKAMPGIEH